ncbi:hypothetical protein MPER_06787, partial [Moniliophthora perniciosa FA553]
IANDIIQEGYNHRWLVIASGTSMIEDIRRATDEQLSLREAVKDFTTDDPDLGGFIQTTLTRKISSKASEVHDEIIAAFEDEIPETLGELDRGPYFVQSFEYSVQGKQSAVCRNEEWKVDWLAIYLSLFLNDFCFQFSIVKWYLNPRTAAYACTSKHLRPIILDRLEKMKAYGEKSRWEGPDDLLMWVMKDTDSKKERLDPEELIGKMLFMNLVAIHTTALTHALLNLALRPELAQPLRDEAEQYPDEG